MLWTLVCVLMVQGEDLCRTIYRQAKRPRGGRAIGPASSPSPTIHRQRPLHCTEGAVAHRSYAHMGLGGNHGGLEASVHEHRHYKNRISAAMPCYVGMDRCVPANDLPKNNLLGVLMISIEMGNSMWIS